MTYRLKDKELQKKLDDISRGEFSQKLNECAKLNGIIGVFEVRFNICGVYVEERQEYNPKSWNDFPAVTPPEGVWMRCEWLPSAKREDCADVVPIVARYVADGNSNEMIWLDYEGREVDVDRYRPWED